MRKILVTGGSGLLGRSIIKTIKQSFDVYSIDKINPSYIKFSNVKYFETDLTNKESLTIIKKINPEILIHCAAVIPEATTYNKEKIRDMNNIIDGNVISAASELSCYLIYTSSTIVYGYTNSHFNISELEPLIALSPYAKQKIETENLLANKIDRFLILRINAPYGKYIFHKTVLSIFVQLALQGKTLQYHGSGNRMQDFTNVDDIANLLYSLLSGNEYRDGIFNISYGNPICMRDLAQLIVNLVGSESRIEPSGLDDKQENYKASYSIEKAKNILGWNPKISLEMGILELINNLRKC